MSGTSQQQINELQSQCHDLLKRNQMLEAANEQQRKSIHDLRTRVTRLEDLFGKAQSDLTYTQQQLQGVIIGFERQHGIVTDHTEQLRLFAGESSRRGAYGKHYGDAKPMFLIVVDWLYSPLVHFVKGLYTLFSPIISTAQSLSLFNSELQNQYQDETNNGRWWADSKQGDLLGLLQSGALDPVSKKKGVS